MVCLEFQALEMGCHCDKSNILCVSHRRSQFYDRLVLNGKVCVIYVAQTPHIRERESIDTFKSFLTTQNDPVRWSVGRLSLFRYRYRYRLSYRSHGALCVYQCVTCV